MKKRKIEGFGGQGSTLQDQRINKQVKILTHKNNKFLKIEDVNIGQETADAMKSELLMVDPTRLSSLKDYINKHMDRMLLSKMNAESKAVQVQLRETMKRKSLMELMGEGKKEGRKRQSLGRVKTAREIIDVEDVESRIDSRDQKKPLKEAFIDS